MDNEPFQSEMESQSKRPYHKPAVQIYGTLKDMTQASNQINTSHVQDNPAPFPPAAQQPRNRT